MDIAFRSKSRHTKRHLLQDPGALAREIAFTDAHPTLCGRYRLGQALPEGDYSAYDMCGQCSSIAARPGRHGARK